MTTFRTYMLKKTYENLQKNGDRLAHVDSLTHWDDFRPTIRPLCRSKTSREEKPNVDEVARVRLLVLARARVFSILRNMFNSRGHCSKMSIIATLVKSWIPGRS